MKEKVQNFMLRNRDKFWQQLTVASTLLAAAVLITGCSGGSHMATVEGTITVDGVQVSQGAIVFEPADGRGPTAGATIKGGSYVAKVPVGEKKVRITGFEVVGQRPAYPGKPNGPMRDIIKETVPAKFNLRSELTQSVESSSGSVDFDLKTS